MGAEIVKLGDSLLPGEPDSEVIEILEGLLERARRGEVVGIAYAVAQANDAIATGWSYPEGQAWKVAAGPVTLQARFGMHFVAQEE